MTIQETSKQAASLDSPRRRLISWGSGGKDDAALDGTRMAYAFKSFEFHPSLNLARHAVPEMQVSHGQITHGGHI
jgi:hypothetical protein